MKNAVMEEDNYHGHIVAACQIPIEFPAHVAETGCCH
jgi:hypothetical protein